MIAMEIITREKDVNLSSNLIENSGIEYNYSRRCSICGSPYMKNTMLPEEMIKILGEKIRYIPSCKCHENFFERKIEELSLKADKERILNKGHKYKDFSVIDNKFLNSTFEKAYHTKNLALCRKYAEAFLTKDVQVGLILYGSPGTGKSFDSACIANYLMEHGKSVLALNLGLYLNRLKLEWSNIEIEVLRKVAECDLLIIDDFGAEKPSDWLIEKAYLLIDTRYKSEKPMIISTNLKYKVKCSCDISEIFGFRVKDRIREMCYEIYYDGKSRRKEANLKFKELMI